MPASLTDMKLNEKYKEKLYGMYKFFGNSQDLFQTYSNRYIHTYKQDWTCYRRIRSISSAKWIIYNANKY